MKTPEFIVVGSAKSGTTSVYNYLKQHPDIFMPDFKEPHYFVSDQPLNFETITDSESYFKLFEDAGDRICGEASTGYLYFPEAAERIKHSLPDTKIVALVRDPVERAFSMWGHQQRESLEPLSFEAAIVLELNGEPRHRDGVEYGFNYCELGLISAQLKRYIELFGHENVFIGDYTELKQDPKTFMRKLFDFLDVDQKFQGNLDRRFNPSGNHKRSKRIFRTLFCQ
jgi:hypothetical protein